MTGATVAERVSRARWVRGRARKENSGSELNAFWREEHAIGGSRNSKCEALEQGLQGGVNEAKR